jgi:inner membrane protein
VRAVTHQIAGVGLAGVSVAVVDARGASAVVLIAGAWIGSLLPDADLAGARVYRRTRFERRAPLLWIVGLLLRLPVRLLTLLPHRGFTHSVLACALAAVLSALAASVVAPDLAVAAAVGVAAGYGAHVAADACTRSGVPLWAPISSRHRWLLPTRARIRTGSAREYLSLALFGLLLFFAALPFLG